MIHTTPVANAWRLYLVTVFQEISALSRDLTTPELLRILIKEKFPGRAVAAASLRARSIFVLKMVTDMPFLMTLRVVRRLH